MIYVQWLLVLAIIALGLFGGYHSHLMIANRKNGRLVSDFLGGWVFNPSGLDADGRRHRRMVFGCWLLAIALAVVLVQLEAVY